MKKCIASLIVAVLFLSIPLFIHAAEVQPEAKSEEFVPFVNHEKGYEISYPKTWNSRSVPNFDLVLMAPSTDPQVPIAATMNLIAEFVGKAITLDIFYDENVPTITKELKGAKVEKSGDRNFGKVPGKWIVYTHEMNDMTFKVMQYFIVDKGYAYLLTFSTLDQEFSKYENEFKKIAESFHLVPAQQGENPKPHD